MIGCVLASPGLGRDSASASMTSALDGLLEGVSEVFDAVAGMYLFLEADLVLVVSYSDMKRKEFKLS